jgi:exopolysaccharide production protein ExoZ
MGGRKLSGIEALRGLAASAVVLYHAARYVRRTCDWNLAEKLFQFGHAGVDLFFVISGFVILYAHYDDLGRPNRIAHYAQRRFTRVLPVYWVALLITIALSRHLHSSSDLFWSFTLLPHQGNPILGIAWTLKYEVAFYTIFAILILNRIAGIAILGAWLGLVIAGNVFGWGGGDFAQLYNPFCFEFFLGMGAAFAVKENLVPNSAVLLSLGLLLLSGTILLEVTNILDGYSGWARLAYGIPSAIIVAECTSWMRIPSVLNVFGKASYSIYLFQFVFIGIVGKIIAGATPSIAFAVLSGVGIGGGIVASRYIEFPLIRLVRHKISREAAAQSA